MQMSQVNPERNLWMKCGFLALCVFSKSIFSRFLLSCSFTTKGERWWGSQSMFYCFVLFFLFLVWGPSEFVPLLYFLHSPFSSLVVWRMYYSCPWVLVGEVQPSDLSFPEVALMMIWEGEWRNMRTAGNLDGRVGELGESRGSKAGGMEKEEFK